MNSLCAEGTMTREKMLKLQSTPKRPIVAVHSCICGQHINPTIGDHGTPHPLRREQLPNGGGVYQCTHCGRTC